MGLWVAASSALTPLPHTAQVPLSRMKIQNNRHCIIACGLTLVAPLFRVVRVFSLPVLLKHPPCHEIGARAVCQACYRADPAGAVVATRRASKAVTTAAMTASAARERHATA